MGCATRCQLEGFCDWFTYSPDVFHTCLGYKKDSYIHIWAFDEYSTTAEMVWSKAKGGGDPMWATDAQLCGRGLPCVGDTNPEFAPQMGRTLRSKHLRRMNASAFAPMWYVSDVVSSAVRIRALLGQSQSRL